MGDKLLMMVLLQRDIYLIVHPHPRRPCSDDLVNLRALAPELLDDLLYDDEGEERDLRLALGSFADIPEVSSRAMYVPDQRIGKTCKAQEIAT